MERIAGFLGIITFIVGLYFLSENRKGIEWRTVLGGLGLQVVFAFLLLGIPVLGVGAPLRFVFSGVNDFINAILNFTLDGSRFIFGILADSEKTGFVFAFQVLPTIIFMASLMSVLYHLGWMQKVVRGLAWAMHKTMGISGAEALSVSADIFLGQTEAPLVIRPYLPRMTKSELFAVMTGGMATVAGGVMAAYVGLLKDKVPDIAGHLLCASVVSAPAALLIAKLLKPETEKPETLGVLPKDNDKELMHANLVDAAASGAADGLRLALNVAAMLLAFIALISLLDGALKVFGQVIHFETWGGFLAAPGAPPELNFSLLLGWIFYPVAVLIGIPVADAQVAGMLLGKKLVLNEFIAYLDLAQIGSGLSERSRVILSYALCGFANFSSIAIQIGGIGGLAPSRQKDIARFGLKAVLGGTAATLLTAALVGIVL